MANGIPGDLTRARTLDDVLAEADAIEAAPRRRLTYGGATANAAEVVQRVLHSRAHDEGATFDGTTGRVVASLPKGASPGRRSVDVHRRVPAIEEAPAGAYRATPVVGELVTVYIEDHLDPPADDRLRTPEEVDSERDARRREDDDAERWATLPAGERAKRDSAAAADAARGARVTGRKRSDRVGRAKPVTGETPEEAQERMRSDPDTGGKPRPAFVGGRVTPESKDALDADQTASNGEVMESVAIVMRKTGKSKAEVLAAIERISETGMIDPDVADALPEAPTLTPNAAA